MRVQCGHCNGDYVQTRSGELRKHSCWRYDQKQQTIVWGSRDIHNRKNGQ